VLRLAQQVDQLAAVEEVVEELREETLLLFRGRRRRRTAGSRGVGTGRRQGRQQAEGKPQEQGVGDEPPKPGGLHDSFLLEGTIPPPVRGPARGRTVTDYLDWAIRQGQVRPRAAVRIGAARTGWPAAPGRGREPRAVGERKPVPLRHGASP